MDESRIRFESQITFWPFLGGGSRFESLIRQFMTRKTWIICKSWITFWLFLSVQIMIRIIKNGDSSIHYVACNALSFFPGFRAQLNKMIKPVLYWTFPFAVCLPTPLVSQFVSLPVHLIVRHLCIRQTANANVQCGTGFSGSTFGCWALMLWDMAPLIQC